MLGTGRSPAQQNIRLLNCICTCALDPDSRFCGEASACFYHPEPIVPFHSFACSDPTLGECVQQGIGCSRTPIDRAPDSCVARCNRIIPPADCCTAHGGAGCEFGACSSCVRSKWGASCLASWDADCARTAVESCARECFCGASPTEDCCAAHGGRGCGLEGCDRCVGNVAGFSCGTSWSPACAEAARTDCAAACLCGELPPRDCCSGHGGRGCALEACEDCVIQQAGIDCARNWSLECAEAARRSCAAACLCAPEPPPDCCTAHGGDGCALRECESCTTRAGASPGCSLFWRAECAEVANRDCAAECLCDTPSPEDCCAANGGRGCGLERCEDCVAARATSACREIWREECADLARRECGEVCACGPVSRRDCCTGGGPPGGPAAGCERRACELCVCDTPELSHCCEDRWDASCIAAAKDRCAEDCGCAVPQPCCRGIEDLPPETATLPGCESRDCTLCVCNERPECCEREWTMRCAELAETTCNQFCRCAAPPPAVDCCAGVRALPPGSRPEPGCNVLGDPADGRDPHACELCVCSELGFADCCTRSWTKKCTEQAAARCDEICRCSSRLDPDCCRGAEFLPRDPPPRPGCQLRSCELCVCSEPAFQGCCTGEWTRACTEQAEGRCAESCGCAPPPTDCCAGAPPLEAAGGGCAVRDCELCVCREPSNEACCTGPWNESCVRQSLGRCAEACDCGEIFDLRRGVGPDETRIPVDDVTQFPSSGIIRIGDEEIRYRIIERDRPPSRGGVLILGERGLGPTTPAAHRAGSDLVLLRNALLAVPGDANCDGEVDPAGTREYAGLDRAVFGAGAVAPCPTADANADARASAADYPALAGVLRP
jgi:hypothetical protein